MQCPNVEKLCELFGEPGRTDSDLWLWNHVESCEACRAELERMSDDDELRSWRDAAEVTSPSLEEFAARKSLLQKLGRLTASTGTHSESMSDTAKIVSRESAYHPSNESIEEHGVLGPYRILKLIGQGGMAMVFEAIDEQLHRKAAIKVLKPDCIEPGAIERLRLEARALAGVNHPHVVSIYGVLSTGKGQPAIAMELIEGESLQDRLRRNQEVTPRMAASWVAGAARGVAAAHRLGVVHRDIKPSNVLLTNGDSQEVPKLVDFGLARFTSVPNTLTQSGMLLGTPAYMSPEHVLGPEHCNASSDIYGLGATLYELLSGVAPFRGAISTILHQISRQAPTPIRALNASIPKDLQTICEKAMAREPHRRYSSAIELAEDLERWDSGLPILARPVTRFEHAISWAKRNPLMAGLASSSMALVLLLLCVATYSTLTIQMGAIALRKEKETVVMANEQLEKAVADAQNQRRVALESLNSLVTKVQAELGTRPGTLPVRRSILETALQGLDQIATETDSSQSNKQDAIAVQAHVTKGEVLDALGDNAAAVVEFELATQLAQDFVRSDLGSDLSKSYLAKALLSRADHATLRNSMDEAAGLYQQVLEIREAQAAKSSKDSEAQRDLALVLQRIGDVRYHRGEYHLAKGFFERSLELFDAQKRVQSNSTLLLRNVCLASQRLANICSILGDQVLAEKHLQLALNVNRSLCEGDPDNRVYQGDRAFLKGNLATFYSNRGNVELALSMAQEAIDCSERVSQSDPSDHSAKQKMGGSWFVLYEIQFAIGNIAAAEKAIQKSIDIDNELCFSDPTSSKYPRHGSDLCIVLAGLQARSGKLLDCANSLQQSVKLLERCRQSADGASDVIIYSIAQLNKSIQGIEIAIESLKNGSHVEMDADDEILHKARITAMYEHARTKDWKRAMEYGTELEKSPSQNIYTRHIDELIIARAYALCFKTLAQEGTEETPELREARSMAMEGLLRCLTSVLAHPSISQNVSAKVSLRREPDFVSIGSRSEFERLLGAGNVP